MVVEQHFQLEGLPFGVGLSMATPIFTKVLSPISTMLFSQGIHIIGYQDDFLLKDRCQDQNLGSQCAADDTDTSEL